MRRLFAIAIVALGLGASSVALAKEASATDAPVKDVAPSEAAVSDEARAAALYAQSTAAYKAGRFENAIVLVKECYYLTKNPMLFQNLARAHDGRGEFEEAIIYYERYLRDVKEVPDRPLLVARVKTLKKIVADKRRPPSPLPWVLSGVGVAGLVVGAALGAVVQSKVAKIVDGMPNVEAVALRDEARGVAVGVNVSFAVGGAVLAAAVVWGIVDVSLSKRGNERPKTVIALGPLGAHFVTRF